MSVKRIERGDRSNRASWKEREKKKILTMESGRRSIGRKKDFFLFLAATRAAAEGPPHRFWLRLQSKGRFEAVSFSQSPAG